MAIRFRVLQFAPRTARPLDGHMEEPFRRGIEQVHAFAGDHPKPFVPVYVEVFHRAPRNAGTVLRIVPEGGEAVAIIAVQSVLGGEPQKAEAVLHDAAHQALRQPVIDGERIERQCDGVHLCADHAYGKQQQERGNAQQVEGTWSLHSITFERFPCTLSRTHRCTCSASFRHE